MKAVMMVVMVLVLGTVLRYGQRYILQKNGLQPVSEQMKDVKFSSEEADLMTTVFKSAIKLFTGQASRKQLAGELSDKLYAGRNGEDMKELGIEMVSPADASSSGGKDPLLGKDAATGAATPGAASTTAGANAANAQPGAAAANPAQAARVAKLAAKNGMPAGIPAGMPSLEMPSAPSLNNAQTTVLTRLWNQVKANSLEFMLVPVVLLGMFLVHRVRNRGGMEGDFLPSLESLQNPAESEPYDMQYAVHTLSTEDFEMLVALIYQRQGYRVSMSSGLSGGRGGDFTLARKAERILVQCKKQSQDHRIPVERVRELHEAMLVANLTRGLYVASCGFSWDARNFAKSKGITVINARTLDALITAARENPEEDLLAVSEWAPKLMGKVQLTPPTCPACEAAMDLVNASNGSVWVCSQRPDCRGRRCARKYQKATPPPAAKNTDQPAEELTA
ncbi:restriction endonuclease [Chthoniobacter flavus Ellin428]|uniref:Restriction endonuclease n=2 Tax=Chthoniobacter flavus TaxID=191863 RepID=B4DAT1_9BACT|nr:restriction endonuclease [Chthoniobacter flavus Ellin428]TCO92758.1 restriction endonuclease [Chthoniobacter flavus]